MHAIDPNMTQWETLDQLTRVVVNPFRIAPGVYEIQRRKNVGGHWYVQYQRFGNIEDVCSDAEYRARFEPLTTAYGAAERRVIE